MNHVVQSGRLTRDPEIRYTKGEKPQPIARYSLAVPRRFKKEGQPTSDFVSVVAFSKEAEFCEKYLKKGMLIGIRGRIQTSSYTDKDSKKRYVTDIIAEEQEFLESKRIYEARKEAQKKDDKSEMKDKHGYVSIDQFDDDDLPF